MTKIIERCYHKSKGDAMKKFYQESINEVFTSVNSSIEGLSTQEAKDRIERSGKNVLREKNKKSAFKIFLSQFNNMMTLLLVLVSRLRPTPPTCGW